MHCVHMYSTLHAHNIVGGGTAAPCPLTVPTPLNYMYYVKKICAH